MTSYGGGYGEEMDVDFGGHDDDVARRRKGTGMETMRAGVTVPIWMVVAKTKMEMTKMIPSFNALSTTLSCEGLKIDVIVIQL